MRWEQKVLSIHSGILAVGFLLLFIFGGMFLTFFVGDVMGAMLLIFLILGFFGPWIIWLYAIYVAGRKAAMSRGVRMMDLRWVFWILLASMPLAGMGVAVGFYAAADLGILLALPLFLVAIGLASAALQRGGEPDGRANLVEQIGCWILLYFLPIGPWLLWGKIKRVRDYPVTPDKVLAGLGVR
jgi:hypothetical protein